MSARAARSDGCVWRGWALITESAVPGRADVRRRSALVELLLGCSWCHARRQRPVVWKVFNRLINASRAFVERPPGESKAFVVARYATLRIGATKAREWLAPLLPSWKSTLPFAHERVDM